MRGEAGFGFAGASPGGFGIDVDEWIEERLDFLDAGEMGFDEFEGREFFAAE